MFPYKVFSLMFFNLYDLIFIIYHLSWRQYQCFNNKVDTSRTVFIIRSYIQDLKNLQDFKYRILR
jgi:hypothetical protein